MQVSYLDSSMEKSHSLFRPGWVHVIKENGDEFRGHVMQLNTGEYVFTKSGRYDWKSTGSWYEGEYDRGEKHGLGAYFDGSSKAAYRGMWAHGFRNGPGTIEYENGDEFNGMFIKDNKHGKGMYTHADTQCFVRGDWKDGEMVAGKWEFALGVSPAVMHKLSAPLLNPPTPAHSGHRALGVVIAGAPASGKGTQAERIRDEFGLIHLSTGDMLRAAVLAGTEVGLKAKAVMEQGGLVSDDIVIEAVRERLHQPDIKKYGFLLDGFPRTPAQAEALKSLGVEIHVFIELDVPDEHILERVTGRRVDPSTGNSYHVKFNPPPAEVEGRLIHRADDTEECVKPRLAAFHENIASIKAHFHNVHVTIDGTKKPDVVWDSIRHDLHRLSRGSELGHLFKNKYGMGSS